MRPHMAIIAAAAVLFVLAGLAAPALAGGSFPICTAAGTQGHPAIDGRRIVWADLRDGTSTIYTYDLANPVPGGVPVCPTGAGQFYPAISGDRVVWVDSNDDIYMYDLANPTPSPVPICTHPAIQASPAISGDRIVWSDRRAGIFNYDIWMYDLANPTPDGVLVSSMPGSQFSPAISGDKVVWSDVLTVGIWSYDLADPASPPQLIDTGSAPQMSGGKVVFNKNKANVLTVWMYDLANPSAGAVMIAEGGYPKISGDKIVSSKYDSLNKTHNINLYDLSNPAAGVMTICTTSFLVRSPAVSGDVIVWEDNRNGNGDIFAYDLSAPNTPPEAPSAPSPADTATGVSLASPVLSWTASDPDLWDGLRYDVYFDFNPDPGSTKAKATGLTGATFSPGQLHCNQTYYWQVVARDYHGAEVAGPVWSFTTTDAGCPAIDAVSPNPCQPGDVLSIVGRNFGGEGVVRLGGATYKPGSSSILSWSDTQIDFQVPDYTAWPCPITRTLTMFVRVKSEGSTFKSNRIPLAIEKPDLGCPTIDGLSPASAAPGEVVSIMGRNFGPAKGVIKVGQRLLEPASINILSWTDTRIDFIAPAFDWVCTAGARTLQLNVKAGPPGSRTNSNQTPLAIHPPAEGCPQLFGVSPASATNTETITLTGELLGSEQGLVVVEEYLDEDWAGCKPLRKVFKPGNPDVLEWTPERVQFRLGALTDWPSIPTEGFKGARIWVKAGPAAARLKSNSHTIRVDGLPHTEIGSGCRH